MVGSWCPPNSEVHGLALHGLAVRSFFLSVLGYEFKQNGTWNKRGRCTIHCPESLRRHLRPLLIRCAETRRLPKRLRADGLRKIPPSVGIFCL